MKETVEKIIKIMGSPRNYGMLTFQILHVKLLNEYINAIP